MKSHLSRSLYSESHGNSLYQIPAVCSLMRRKHIEVDRVVEAISLEIEVVVAVEVKAILTI